MTPDVPTAGHNVRAQHPARQSPTIGLIKAAESIAQAPIHRSMNVHVLFPDCDQILASGVCWPSSDI